MNKLIYPLDRLSILFHNDHLDLLSKETLLCQIAFVFTMNANIWEICHWNLFWHQKQNKRAGFHNQFCYAVEGGGGFYCFGCMRMKTKFSFHCFERVTLKYNSMQNPTTIQVQGLDELFFNVHS